MSDGRPTTIRTSMPLLAELTPAGGIGLAPPIRLRVSQLVVRMPDGTPIVVVAEYGPTGTYAVSTVGDDDFNRMLRTLGLDVTTVVVDTLEMPEPIPGARLVAGPKPGE